MNTETPKKGQVNSIKQYFSPSRNPISTPLKTRSKVTIQPRSPSTSPYKDTPIQNNNLKTSTRHKTKLKRPSEEPTEPTLTPKTAKMAPKKSSDKTTLEESPHETPDVPTTLHDIKKILLEKFKTQQNNLKLTSKAKMTNSKPPLPNTK